MQKIKEWFFLILIFIFLISLMVINYLREANSMNFIELNILPTSISKMDDNSIWCPTLQLIWNDLKNKVVGQDIEFIIDKQNQDVFDLNKESFKDIMINSNYFYKNYDYMTPEFKKIIENDIWNKFKEKSDILDRFNFKENSQDYFFYSMLVRDFKFKNPFDILSNNTFGINSQSSELLDENVKVLFYKDSEYAVKLLTIDGDDVILYKGECGNNFSDTYKKIKNNLKESIFDSLDTIEIANLNFKTESRYPYLINKDFYDINGISHRIDEILQTIMFNFNNTGGKVKSEAGMNVKTTSLEHGRHFDFTDDFVLFLKESDKNEPYFAINVTSINEFYK